MQRFINNWTAELIDAAEPGDTELTVSPEAASRLSGLGSGDHYVMTTALLDEAGAEVGWEILHVTAATGGVLTVARAKEGTTASELPAGTPISARLTAAPLHALLEGNAAMAEAITQLAARVAALEPPDEAQEFTLSITVGEGTDGAEGYIGWSSWDEYGACSPDAIEIAGVGAVPVVEVVISPYGTVWQLHVHLDAGGLLAQESLTAQLDGAGELIGAEAFFDVSEEDTYWRWELSSNPWGAGQTYEIVLQLRP